MNCNQAISFLRTILKISDVKQKLGQDKYQLLCEIVKEFHEKVPFQNYTAFANPEKAMIRPSVTEVIEQLTSGCGGLCYSVNVFAKLLLEALGYSVYHIISSVKGLPDNHVITVVTDICTPGDKYLVEVATGFPTFKPIPLDFDTESPTYDESFTKYRFKRIDDTHFVREMKYHMPDSKWELFYSWEATPKKLEEMSEAMDAVYTDPTITPFHTSLRAVRFHNGRAVCIRNMTLLIEDENHMLQPKKLQEDEFLAAVREHFPELEEAAKKALNNWTPNDAPEIGV